MPFSFSHVGKKRGEYWYINAKTRQHKVLPGVYQALFIVNSINNGGQLDRFGFAVFGDRDRIGNDLRFV